jgi:hypothetical protein
VFTQYRQQSANETFAEENFEDLRAEWQKGALAGATWRVIVNPAEDLPEQKSLNLLVLPPSLAWDENGGAKDLPAPRACTEHAARQSAAGRPSRQRAKRRGRPQVHLAGTAAAVTSGEGTDAVDALAEGLAAILAALPAEQRAELLRRLEGGSGDGP